MPNVDFNFHWKWEREMREMRLMQKSAHVISLEYSGEKYKKKICIGMTTCPGVMPQYPHAHPVEDKVAESDERTFLFDNFVVVLFVALDKSKGNYGCALRKRLGREFGLSIQNFVWCDERIIPQDPRLAVAGFVTNYVVWRLARDGFEWFALILREINLV